MNPFNNTTRGAIVAQVGHKKRFSPMKEENLSSLYGTKNTSLKLYISAQICKEWPFLANHLKKDKANKRGFKYHSWRNLGANQKISTFE